MGVTKALDYSDKQLNLASIAKALAHPARVAILDHLIAAKRCINSDLVQELGLAQPTISQHLQELKKAQLIKGTVSGTRLHYCINRDVWEATQDLIGIFFKQFEDAEDTKVCC